MNESEQAQAIAVKDLYWCSEGCGFVNERHRCEQWCNPNYIPKAAVKSIVDSQAQKIAQLTKERDEMTAAAYRLGSEAQQHISEARELAEKYRDMYCVKSPKPAMLPWEKR